MKMSKTNEKADDLLKFTSQLIHFKKVNIFGCEGTGKKSLANLLECFYNQSKESLIKSEENNKNENDNKEAKNDKVDLYSSGLAQDNIENEEQNNSDNQDKDNPNLNNEDNISSSSKTSMTKSKLQIVSSVKRKKVSTSTGAKMYYNFFLTNLGNNQFLEMNLDTLFFHSEAFIFVFDITNQETYKEVKSIIEIIQQKKIYKQPKFLIANKLDMEYNRDVSGFEVKEFCDLHNDINFIELSVKDKDGVEQLINKLYSVLYNNGIKQKDRDIPFDAMHLVSIQDPPLLKSQSDLSQIATSLSQKMIPLTLFMIGNSQVGKTSFISKFFNIDDGGTRISTVGVDVAKTYGKVINYLVRIEVWDTAGQERFRAIQRKYYQKSDGFLLIFDVSKKDTFEDIKKWLKDIKDNRAREGKEGEEIKKNEKDEDIVYLVGNKIDLFNEREVDKKDAMKLAEECGLRYFEISVKKGINVYELMLELIFNAFQKSKHSYSDAIKIGPGNSSNSNNNRKKKCC